MAVTIDAVSNSGATNSVASKTWSHTTSGQNRLLLMSVHFNRPAGTETVSSVTYDGNALTQVGTTVTAGSSGLDRCVAMYRLVAPATGTKTIVVTMSTSLAFYAGAVTYNGAHQTTPVGTPVTASSTTSASIAATTASVGTNLVFSAASIRTASTTTVPTTTEWNALVGTNNQFAGAVQPGASSVTSTYSWTGADNAALIAVDVKASSSLAITSQASIIGSGMSGLTDDFTTKDLTKWVNPGGGDWVTGVSVVAGQLNIIPATTYREIDATNARDLRNDAAMVQIVQRPTQTGDGANSTEMGFGVQIDSNNSFVAILNGTGNIVWRTKNAGTSGTTSYTAYSSTSMRWIRWRNSGTNVYLEAAPTSSGTWSILATYPVTFSLAAVKAVMYAGYYGTVASPGTAIFDNFNLSGTAKTVTSQARIKAIGTTTVSSQASITVGNNLVVGGLAFPGNPIKSINSRASIVTTRTATVTSRASIAPPPIDLSVRPVVSDDAEELYVRLGSPYNSEDGQNNWALLRFCQAVCTGLQEVDDLVRDSDQGVGWSSVMDIDRVPDQALPWLAQFVGVTTLDNLDPDAQRLRIKETAGFQRGTVSAIAGAARQHLTGNKTVVVTERTSSAYHLRVTTFLTETPDPATTEAAVRAQKPAGLVLDFVVSTGATYGALKATGMTYGDLSAAYPTYRVMKLAILV